MNHEEIKSIIPFQLYEGLHIVRKTGNNAAHYGNRITTKDALISIRYSYDFEINFLYKIGLSIRCLRFLSYLRSLIFV